MTGREERIFYGQSLSLAKDLLIEQHKKGSNQETKIGSKKFIQKMYELARDIIEQGYEQGYLTWESQDFIPEEEIEKMVKEINLDNTTPDPMTPKQKKYIQKLLRERNKKWPEEYNQLTKQQASKVIDKLTK